MEPLATTQEINLIRALNALEARGDTLDRPVDPELRRLATEYRHAMLRNIVARLSGVELTIGADNIVDMFDALVDAEMADKAHPAAPALRGALLERLGQHPGGAIAVRALTRYAPPAKPPRAAAAATPALAPEAAVAVTAAALGAADEPDAFTFGPPPKTPEPAEDAASEDSQRGEFAERVAEVLNGTIVGTDEEAAQVAAEGGEEAASRGRPRGPIGRAMDALTKLGPHEPGREPGSVPGNVPKPAGATAAASSSPRRSV